MEPRSRKSWWVLAGLLFCLLLVCTGSAWGQQQQPPAGFVVPVAPVAKQSSGQMVFWSVDNSGNLFAATGAGGPFATGQPNPTGYVVPYAPVAQTPSGAWAFLKVDASGNLQTSGASGGPFTTNGILFGNGTSIIQVTAAGGAGTLCLVETNGGLPTFGSCSGTASTLWSALTAPTASLSITMPAGDITTLTWAAQASPATSDFSWVAGADTGVASASIFAFLDTTGNVRTGPLVDVHTVGTSSALPVRITAQGTANGVQMSTAGLLAAIGTGGINATQVNGAAVPTSATVLGSNGSNQLVSLATTGSGSAVLATSPILVTPNLGTPSAAVLTNATGLPVGAITGLGTGVATFLATPSSGNLAAAVTGETGTGALVFATSPALAGTATAVNITLTGLLTTAASAAGGAGLNLPHGVAPTTPNNGDLWTTTAGLFAQINGATVGPFGTGAGSITLQTNGVANGSNSALNFVTSATNSTGLSATPSNINTNQEKIEVGGTLNLASLTAPAAAGDEVCGNSTPVWSDCVPGVAGRTVTIATDTITAGDRLNSVLYNSASAVAVTLTSAASLGNNFAFKTCNENTGSATFIPGAGQINGGGSLVLAEGQCASISSPDNVNYIASISNGAISTDTSLSITRSPFGVQLGLSPTSFPFSGGPAGTSFQDVTETTNPGNPASGIDRVYFDSTTHLLTCHTSSGGNCAPSGGSTPTFDSGGTGLGQPAANAAWTMGANTISYTFGATTGTNNLINVTDTLNNTGTGYLLKAGTAGGSAASGLDLFATGSAAGAFTNAFALNVSNPTAATSSQAQPSPKMEMSGRTWSGVTPADTAESWSWQVVPAANTSNPAVNLTLVHESGTTGPLGIVLPASLTLTANTFTANSTTGGFTWNGPSSSLISLSSGGNANVTSTSSGSVNINGGQILISPSGTNSIKLLGSSTASDVVAVIHFGNASPTGDALDFQNSSNVVQASLGPNFTFTKYNSTALVGSGMDYDVFNTVHGNTNTSITSTTLATVGAADQNFTVTGGISQVDVGTTCTVAGSVQVNIIYTDALSGVAVTVSPDIDAGTTLPAITLPFSTSAVGAANVGTFRWMARAKASTTISYSTTYNNGTCGTQANMNIAPVLELR